MTGKKSKEMTSRVIKTSQNLNECNRCAVLFSGEFKREGLFVIWFRKYNIQAKIDISKDKA